MLKILLRPGDKIITENGYKGDFKVFTPYDSNNKKNRRVINLIRAR